MNDHRLWSAVPDPLLSSPASLTGAGVEVATVLHQIADLLELRGEASHRVRAYRQAARALSARHARPTPGDMQGVPLQPLPALDAQVGRRILASVAGGPAGLLPELLPGVPPAATALLRVPGIGVARAAAVCRQLQVESPEQLAAAALAGSLRSVPGFGPRLEQLLLRQLDPDVASQRHWRRRDVVPVAESLVEELRAIDGVTRAEIAGCLRRGCAEVGEIQLVLAASRQSDVLARFASDARVERVLSCGTTRGRVQLEDGLHVDVRAVPLASFGTALLCLTGSRPHVLALRRMASQRGMKLSEYGLFRGTRRIAGATEASVYEALGLPWIAPELREARGELDEASPRLVSSSDLHGDLHVRSSDSDGLDPLEALVMGAARRGLHYLAITDPALRETAAHGLDADALARQIDRIEAINAVEGAACGVTLLKGVEVGILADGSLGLPDELLGRMDIVVAKVDGSFGLSREQQTLRLMRAIDHPHFSVLANARGRCAGAGAGMSIDLPVVLAHARQRGCFVELGARGQGIDLDDLGCRMARDAGVLVSVASHARCANGVGQFDDAVIQARRGWLGPPDVLNSRPLHDVMALLAPTMSRSAPAPRKRRSTADLGRA